jgi:hypothetical protein
MAIVGEKRLSRVQPGVQYRQNHPVPDEALPRKRPRRLKPNRRTAILDTSRVPTGEKRVVRTRRERYQLWKREKGDRIIRWNLIQIRRV